MKKKSMLFLLLICGNWLFAQSNINVMSYNLLIYPEGEMLNRIDTLSKILDYYKPDLLLVQELKSEQGLQNIAQELNALFGDYKAGTYAPQISNPSNSWRLQQNIVFNENVFELESETVIETPYRDINYFELRLLENGMPSTELLYVYVTHLKSSQGTTNEQLRLSMAEVLKNQVSLLPNGSNIIVAGDFNVYYGGEPAYELLLSANGNNTLHDPIDMPGWANTNFSNQEIFTQSTRLSSLNDGSGGGIDDRFDFILLSEQLMNANSKMTYQEGSYRALGNNGTCYNQDLIDCTTTDNVPFEMLRSLYHMSDHLPIVLSLDINEAVSTNALPFLENNNIVIAPNPANDQIEVESIGATATQLRILNVQGQFLLEQKMQQQKERIDIAQLPFGLYILQTIGKDGAILAAAKLLIQK